MTYSPYTYIAMYYVSPLLRSNKPVYDINIFTCMVFPCREEGEGPDVVVDQSQDTEKQLLSEFEEKKRKILRDVEVRIVPVEGYLSTPHVCYKL